MEALFARRLLGFLRDNQPSDFFHLLNRLCTNDTRFQIMGEMREAFPHVPDFAEI